MALKRTDIDDFEVWWKYNYEGMTMQDIADYYGCSKSCIQSRLNPEKKKEYNEKWLLENLGYKKEWYIENSEDVKESVRQWRLEHPEYNKEYMRKWHPEHPEYGKEWWKTDNGKACIIRQNAKRHGLGCIELNKPFNGSEGHHIDNEHVIHIPAELHRSIYHNLKTGQGMEEINTIAFRYITEEMFDKLLAGDI